MTINQNPDDAANLIRQKLANLYEGEPDAKVELQESIISPHRSKHQAFMYDLSNSGKSLAEIQTEWHKYYQGLSNDEKHEVWNEFYREYDSQRLPKIFKSQKPAEPKPEEPARKPANAYKNPVYHHVIKKIPRELPSLPQELPRTVAHLKSQLLKKVAHHAKAKPKEHLKSLGFGLACGFAAMVIFLFGFFNERFVAPFITPSRSISNSPIVIDATSTPATNEPLIIIPKINVQIPVIYTEPSVDEAAVQKALEGGVLHYATTPNPGEKGNGAIFGHSSNNIFNKGKYKFAFVLLNRLVPGDTFTLQKDGKRYIYKVYERKIVPPTDLSVIGPQPGKISTMTLITCDPPGTTINRLAVFGEQISPDPATNIDSTASSSPTNVPTFLPSNAPSLWSRIVSWLSG